MASAAEALLLLVRTFESQGAVLEAIKCHAALCSGGKPLPVIEVESQMALASLLITHTHNIQEARQRLERAQRLAAKLPKALVTKCRVALALAKCQGLQGEQRLQRQTLQRALDLCSKSSSPDERDELAPWHARLLMQLAAAVAEQDASDAIPYINMACDVTPAGQMVIPVLAKAQLYASMGLVAQAEAALAQAESLLDDGMPADSARQWRVHHWLLTRLLQLWKGDTLAMQQTEAGDASLVTALEGHLESISGGSWQGAWLPKEATCALACLVTACTLRPGVEVMKALALVERGLTFIQEGLNAEGIDCQCGEASVAAGARRNVKALLLLNSLLLESAALAHLTMTEHAQAQQHIQSMRQLYSRFPTLLQGALLSIHMVTGHYLQSLGLHREAAAAYETATSCGPRGASSSLSRVAELYKGLALAGSGTPDAVEAAYGILNRISEEPDQDPTPILVLRELLGSVVAGCQGEAKQRKHLLSKALKRAHNVLGNHQLVSQVLNALAPLQQEQGDMSGADSMLKSSFTLSKNLHDLHSQVQALAAIIDLKKVTKERPEQIAEAETYHERKQKQLLQLREASLSSGAHQQIAASSV